MSPVARSVAILLAAVLASCRTAPALQADVEPLPVASAEAIEAGREFAVIHCASCHAVATRDTSRRREAPAFRTLSERYPISELRESLADGIMVGDPDMPEWRLTEDEITSLIGYIASIQRNRRQD